MDKLIIIRHGDYDGVNLSDFGKRQMAELGNRLMPQINGDVLILSSTAPRARESAEILGKAFNVSIEDHEILWSDRSHYEDFPKVLELVRSKKEEVDVLILVTHLEYVYGFPGHFGQTELEISTFPYREIGKGTAWVIHCEGKTIEHVHNNLY